MLTVAPNLRDLGGRETADGGTVRRGLVFRSEAVLDPTGGDADALAAMGIVLVCDLRSDGERERAPNVFWEARGVERASFDLLAAIPDAAGPWRILAEQPDAAGADAAMRSVYAAMPSSALGHVGSLLRRLADGGLPALIHCTAGKDRTGFVSAVLLSMLGVAWAGVVADYLDSRGRRTVAAADATRAMVLERAGRELEPSALEAMMGVERSYLEAAFGVIASDFGGLDAYLDRAGADAGVRRRLADRLLG